MAAQQKVILIVTHDQTKKSTFEGKIKFNQKYKNRGYLNPQTFPPIEFIFATAQTSSMTEVEITAEIDAPLAQYQHTLRYAFIEANFRHGAHPDFTFNTNLFDTYLNISFVLFTSTADTHNSNLPFCHAQVQAWHQAQPPQRTNVSAYLYSALTAAPFTQILNGITWP